MSAEIVSPGVTPRAWAAFATALLIASLSYALLRLPVQVSDSVEEIVMAQQSPGVVDAFLSTIGDRAYFRPLRIAETKLLFDLSGGNYYAAYRGFHVVLLAAAIVLFVRLLDIKTTIDLYAGLFALGALVGLHTFTGLMREAFPVNHFLQVVVCCLIAANLSRARPRWWIDVLAALTFIAACLTLESGVLVMVVLAAGRIAGLRGVSDRGLAVVAILLAGYLWLRFGYLANGVNELGTSSGYGFERLSPDEIRDRFGTGVSRFTAYNIMAAILSVLFSEPRVGVFVLVRQWVAGDVAPYFWIAFATSTLTTGVIVAAAVSWLSTPRDRRVPATELFLFAAVLAANAVTSYAYVKDEIVTVAGVFYALAAFWAVRMFLLSTPGRSLGSAIVLAAVLFLAACGWGMRTLGVQNLMRVQAFRLHSDWGRVPETLIAAGKWPDEPAARALVLDLRRQALTIPAPNPRFLPRWVDRFFESD